MRVSVTEVMDGNASEDVIVSLENRDFSVASFLVMQDLTNTCSARFAVNVMLEWFKHDGNTDFTITRQEENEPRVNYVWTYEA